MDDRPRLSCYLAALTIPALSSLLGYVGGEGFRLQAEYQKLRGEWHADATARVIGYPGVTPAYSFADGPPNWLHDEGDSSLLWAGWDRDAHQHQWFTVGQGELDPKRLSHPMGRDSIRAIDRPRVEIHGGEYWDRIPPENIVATGVFLGVPVAYPMGVMDKILIVNDVVQTKPLLVVYTPFVADAHAVEIFNPTLGTQRLTMGHSGYLWDGRPLLYDRETQGLWVPSNEGLKGLAGSAKGKVLPRLAHLDPVPWGTWSAAHPDGRLVAGAYRSELNLFRP